MNTPAENPALSYTKIPVDDGCTHMLEKISALVPLIIYTYDAATKKVHYLNNKVTEILGFEVEEVDTWDSYLKNVVHKDDAATATLEMAKLYLLKDDETITYQSRLNHKQGYSKYFKTSGCLLKQGESEQQFLFTAEDISHTIKAEEEIRAKNDHTNEIEELQMRLEKEQFLESGYWEVDLTTGKISWSDGMYWLFGYDPQTELLPEPSAELYFSHFSDEETERTIKNWTEFLSSTDKFIREETITAKNGVKKRLETYGKIIRQSDGSAVKVIGATKNISRLKEYERQFEKKLIELERSNKELEEFAYVASHDLQEPLRKIATFSERLKAKFENELGDDGKAYITRMLSATANMRALIENLLNFSRLTLKAVEYITTDLNVLMDEVLTEIELQLDESRATVNKQILPVLPVIPSQIKQLFSNIILNAIKFRRPDAAPVVGISCVKLTDAEKDNYYLQKNITYYGISIRDNGIGFEQEYAEKIFQIFQRLHGKSEYPGAGIGLAICKKIAENHHGKLFAVSQIGNGAIFTVILPETNG